MKKLVICCAASWIVLAAMVFGLFQYASQLEVTMEAPAARLLAGENDRLTLQWTPVDYATSYRVYTTNESGGWVLLKAVGSGVTSFELPAGSSLEGTYAVRSCNVSMEKTTLSAYSRAVAGEP